MSIISGYLVLIASAFLFYFPAFMLDIKQNVFLPTQSQARHKYNIGMGITFTLVICTVVYVMLHEEMLGAKYLLLLVPPVSSISLFDAIFTLITGVYPLHAIERVILFQNSDTGGMKKVAIWQIGFAISYSVAALILYFN